MRIAGLALGLKTFVHSGAAVSVFKKELLDTVDGTPSKRLFLSIISDYDLKTGLCELIDNALDQWMNDGKKGPLLIDVSLNVARQTISVADNGGGVDEANVRLLIAPGATHLVQEEYPTWKTCGSEIGSFWKTSLGLLD